MKRIITVAVCVSFLLIGCTKPSYKSMNIQRSALRSVSDSGTTVSLDTVPLTKVAEVRNRTKQIAEEMHKLLETGTVGQMTLAELRKQLSKIVPEDYAFLIELALSRLVGIEVPVDKIGGDNVRRVNAFCVGVITACERYKLADRPTGERGAVDGTVGSSVLSAFGEEMLKNNK